MTDRDAAKTRIVIALTELTPLQRFWQEALQHLRGQPSEILAVFFADDQWHRAASLPFTREISRLSGIDADFTLQRANQVHEEAIAGARRRIHELAAEAKLSLGFEVLLESDQQRIIEVIAGPQNILIAPSLIARRPIFTALQKFGCRIVLIETDENADERR